ncbi:MAG: hypothetical protein L6R30_24640 [Thermoanaerobaculia bacterium]|nr:hypothetical protein [Thermoanaerobaculia bacterium]
MSNASPAQGSFRVRRLAWVLVALSVLCSGIARADVGTPLIWAGFFYLLLGNAVVGIFEGFLVAQFLDVQRLKTILVMVAANYFSAWIGYLGLVWLTPKIGPTIETASLYLGAGIAASWAVTVLLEWPFILACVWRDRHPVRRSFLASISVQSLSYAVIFGWFYLASGASLVTRTHVRPYREFNQNPGATVYFIGVRDGDVWRMGLRDGVIHPIATLRSKDHGDVLFVRRAGEGVWDLSAVTVNRQTEKPVETVVRRGIRAVSAPLRDELRSEGGVQMIRYSFAPVVDLRPWAEGLWTFRTGVWPIEGLSWWRGGTSERDEVALETPFLSWTITNATVLPGDQVVFQLGDDQICLFYRASLSVALVARGRAPLVVIE